MVCNKEEEVTKRLPYSWQLPPTAKQCLAITRLAQALGIREPIENSPSNRWEARRMLYDLKNRVKLKEQEVKK